MIPIRAAARLRAAEFVGARPTLWFRVQQLKGGDAVLWCRKLQNGLYDLFHPTPMGPYQSGLTDQFLKSRVRAVRDPKGQVKYATPDEQRHLQRLINQYKDLQ